MFKESFVFRVENFILDQQRSISATDGSGPPDNLVLSVFWKIDDSPVQLGFTVPIAQQIYSNTSIDLGRWAQTDPILVTDELSIVSVMYQVINLSGGYSGMFDPIFNELNQAIMPTINNILGALDVGIVGPIVNIVEAALNFIYGASSVPSCSGLVHLHQDQYTGGLLADLTANYKVHRIANTPSVPLTTDNGCGTPASRLSLAVERVPALIAAAAPPKSSDRSIILTHTVPWGPTTAVTFDPRNPPGSIQSGCTLNEPVHGGVSCIAPGGGNDDEVSPVHLFALAQSDNQILHAWRDGDGWHNWHRYEGEQPFENLIALTSKGSAVDIFTADWSGIVYHSSVGANGDLGQFTYQPVDPNHNPFQPTFQWGSGVSMVGVWDSRQGFNILAGIQPIGNEYFFGNRLAGGTIAFSTFKSPNKWTALTGEIDSVAPIFMVIGPNTIAPVVDPVGDGMVETFAIGHDSGIYSSLVFGYEDAVGTVGNNVEALNHIPGPDAKELTAAQNPATGTVWVAYIGTDQQVYVGAWVNGEFPGYWGFPIDQLSNKGQFFHLGGDFIGRPVIVPDPSVKTRTFFFVLGRDNKIHWKYCDQPDGTTPDEAIFTPPGLKWNGPVPMPGPFDAGKNVVASRQFAPVHQTDLFLIDNFGQLNIFWVEGSGSWHGPDKIGPAGIAPSGAPLAVSQQFGLNQTDVFLVDKEGQLNVFWVSEEGGWNGPQKTGPAGIFFPGSKLAAYRQFGVDQTDVFLIDIFGQLNVFWSQEVGIWNGPVMIGPPGFAPPGAALAAQQAGVNNTGVFVIDNTGVLNVFSVFELGTWNGPVPYPSGIVAPPGAALAASPQVGASNQTDVFFVDNHGQLSVFSVDGLGNGSGPDAVGPTGIAAPGAALTASQQFGAGQTDVFIVDTKGQVNVLSVDGQGTWSGPDKIGPVGFAPPGAVLTASQQFGANNQTDLFLIDNEGHANVFWVQGPGTWASKPHVLA